MYLGESDWFGLNRISVRCRGTVSNKEARVMLKYLITCMVIKINMQIATFLTLKDLSSYNY